MRGELAARTLAGALEPLALDLRSEETLAQLLDRGTLDDWRELYRLARRDDELRARLVRVVSRVPLGYPHFWRAALASLGEPVDTVANSGLGVILLDINVVSAVRRREVPRSLAGRGAGGSRYFCAAAPPTAAASWGAG